MGKIRIILCDDEEQFARLLEKELRSFMKEQNLEVELVWFGSGEQLLSGLRSNPAPDLLFMDIDLGTSDGVEVVREIRKEHPGLPVIFLSGMEERVLDGYDVKALYFLFKKDYEKRLAGILERYLKEYFYASRIMVKERDGIRILSLQEICWLEAEERGTRIHGQGDMLQSNDTIHSFVKQLPEDLFIEVYHCIYVNVDHIGRVDADTLLLDNGDVVPVSRRKRKSVVAAVMRRLVAG